MNQDEKIPKFMLMLMSSLDQITNTVKVAVRNGENPLVALGIAHLSPIEQQMLLTNLYNKLLLLRAAIQRGV